MTTYRELEYARLKKDYDEIYAKRKSLIDQFLEKVTTSKIKYKNLYASIGETLYSEEFEYKGFKWFFRNNEEMDGLVYHDDKGKFVDTHLPYALEKWIKLSSSQFKENLQLFAEFLDMIIKLINQKYEEFLKKKIDQYEDLLERMK